ncbi:hypothetical protein QJS10_CPA05g02348 [Acorus calamus]|uniref:Selenoprotein H n=1 Tax=Acorus calamus TaxID=4465 RepID=A0AAV9EXB5_ACOCL|nr:hypothetical protein QJS10_CPA05g02348 [Acorus calamus]
MARERKPSDLTKPSPSPRKTRGYYKRTGNTPPAPAEDAPPAKKQPRKRAAAASSPAPSESVVTKQPRAAKRKAESADGDPSAVSPSKWQLRKQTNIAAAEAALAEEEEMVASPSKVPASGSARKGKGKSASTIPAVDPPSDSDSKTVIIVEACKQCQSFKRRAMEVKAGLEKMDPGIVVKVNPEKPRKGCFEVREENGQLFVSLLDMKRPFTPMKQLKLDEIISEIIEKING